MLVEMRYTESDWQRYRWWGKAAACGQSAAVFGLHRVAVEQLRLWDEGSGSGRVVFEIVRCAAATWTSNRAAALDSLSVAPLIALALST